MKVLSLGLCHNSCSEYIISPLTTQLPYPHILYLSIYLSLSISLFISHYLLNHVHISIYIDTYILPPSFSLLSRNSPSPPPSCCPALYSTDNSTHIMTALELSSLIIIIQLFIECCLCRVLSVPTHKLVSQLQHLLSMWLQANYLTSLNLCFYIWNWHNDGTYPVLSTEHQLCTWPHCRC